MLNVSWQNDGAGRIGWWRTDSGDSKDGCQDTRPNIKGNGNVELSNILVQENVVDLWAREGENPYRHDAG